MPNFLEAQSLVRRYLGTRVPLTVIQSIEPARTISLITEYANHMHALTFFRHSLSDDIRELLTRQLHSKDTSLALAMEQTRSTFKSRVNANFIFTDVEDLDQESPISRCFTELVRLAESWQGTITLISLSPMWTGLSRLDMNVALEPPNKDKMCLVVTGMTGDHRQVVQVEWGDTEVTRAAEILAGITEIEAINMVASLVTKGMVRNEDLSEPGFFKDWILGSPGGVERIPLRENFTVGGLGNLKDWLRPREQLMKADLTDTPLHPPEGVLLVGIPGYGESLSVKVIASQWGLPLHRLDMTPVSDMYVGQSEGKLREALATAERVAPCVLWINEIGKGPAQGSDGGTTRYPIGQSLFWMQGLTAKVFTVAAANDVSTLPPESLRKGRFDELFFVNLPEAPNREEIIGLYLRKYLGAGPSQELLTDLVILTDGFSGSDIDAVIHDIVTKVYVNRIPRLPPESETKKFFISVVPFSRTNPEDLAAIRSWGSIRCVPAARHITSNTPAALAGRRVAILQRIRRKHWSNTSLPDVRQPSRWECLPCRQTPALWRRHMAAR